MIRKDRLRATGNYKLYATHKILIVDDERPAREYITELVMSYVPNSKVVQADSALNALSRLQVEDFDLIFVDIGSGSA